MNVKNIVQTGRKLNNQTIYYFSFIFKGTIRIRINTRNKNKTFKYLERYV